MNSEIAPSDFTENADAVRPMNVGKIHKRITLPEAFLAVAVGITGFVSIDRIQKKFIDLNYAAQKSERHAMADENGYILRHDTNTTDGAFIVSASLTDQKMPIDSLDKVALERRSNDDEKARQLSLGAALVAGSGVLGWCHMRRRKDLPRKSPL